MEDEGDDLEPKKENRHAFIVHGEEDLVSETKNTSSSSRGR
jgi:hypothetical protein